MNFKTAAYSRLVLRALAGEKTAGVLGAVGSAAKSVGNAANSVWQKSMKHNGPVMGTLGLGLGAAGMYALGKNAINTIRASYSGFDPNVQAYTQQTY